MTNWAKTLFPPISPAGDNNRPLLALAMAGGLTTLSGGAFLPVFPEMVADLEIDRQWVGALAGIHILFGAVFTPVIGYCADRVGRLRVLIAALLAYALFGMATALLSEIGWLLVARALFGVANGGISAATLGILTGIFTGANRTHVFGYATSILSLASIATFLLGGMAGAADWRHAFYLYGLGVPVALFAAVVLRHRAGPASPDLTSGVDRSFASILLSRRILIVCAGILLVAGVATGMRIYGPIHLKAAFATGPAANGIMLAVMALGVVLSSALVSGRLVHTLGAFRAISLGFTAMGLALIAFVLLDRLEVLGFAFFLFGGGFGIAIPALFDCLASLAPGSRQATVLAIGSGLNSLGLFAGPIVLGFVWIQFGLTEVFVVASALILLGSIAFLSARRLLARIRHE